MREFGFELRLCARLEANGEFVARQLGGGVVAPGRRVVDIVCLEPGSAFDDRVSLTPATIPDAAIEADVGRGKARYWRDAFADVAVSDERARDVIERAVEIGFFEQERRNGRLYVRQVDRYPAEWFDRLIAIENKPDLDDPGALYQQLRYDVALGLFDAVILATESYVTRAVLHRLPDPVGVWRVHDDHVETVRNPLPLAVDEPGVEILDERPAVSDIELVDSAQKTRYRRRVAERAFGKGWRTFAVPGCSQIEVTPVEDVLAVPWCEWHERVVNPATECGPACPGYSAATPPSVDLEAARAQTSPWVRDPERRPPRQSGLTWFD